jgi:adhesin/invasin
MPHLFRRSLPVALTAFLGAFVSACQDEVPPPSAVVVVGEASFTGTVAELIPSPLTVKVTDAKGKPLGGVAVTFAVAEGGGSVSLAVDTTTVAGTAATSWRLGERAGAQRVTASVAGVTGQVSFTATARPGAPASIAANGGNQQTVVVGTAVLTAPSVIVRDRFTNPVSGVSVLFTVASGGGTITGNAGTTNSSGVAAVGEWKMGTVVGTNTLTALALGSGITGNPVTFTATATAGAAAVITAPGGTSLSGIVYRAMSPVPQVRVADASGNPVSGATVTFTGSTGSTVVPTGGTKTTDANGLAAPDGWVLGTAVGSYTLTAAVSGAPSLVITASARADVPSAMTITAGNNQTVQAGRAVPIEPTVRVADQHGNPVPGVEVLFEVGSGGGTAVGRRATTNAQGTAAVGGWTLGDAVGTNTLVASVTTSGVSVTPVTFTATATAGSAATMAASAGQNQSAPAGTAVATAPAVVVRDARGNPVANVSVTFSVGSGGGTVVDATAITNASGVAAVGSWVLGGSVGTQTLVARSGTLPEVTFTATATAGAATMVTAWSQTPLTNIAAGTALSASQRPAVRVTDALGNPVPGVTVTFAVAGDGSSGSIAAGVFSATATTNSNGIATVSAWTVRQTPGTATMSASVTGLTDVVNFTITTIAGPAARMTAVAGTASEDKLFGEAFSVMPSVIVRDAFDNPVSGVTVTFTAGGASGAINPTSVATGSNGIASLTSWAASATQLGTASVTASYFSFSTLFTRRVIASAANSTVAAAALSVNQGLTTTITVTLKSVGGATILTASGAEAVSSFSAVPTPVAGVAGTLGAFTCSSGVCTATYTAPAATGTSRLNITIGGVDVSGSPVTIATP